MEIRALTGFSEETRRKYGRTYSPLNGVHTLLGVGEIDYFEYLSKNPEAKKGVNEDGTIFYELGDFIYYSNGRKASKITKEMSNYDPKEGRRGFGKNSKFIKPVLYTVGGLTALYIVSKLLK